MAHPVVRTATEHRWRLGLIDALDTGHETLLLHTSAPATLHVRGTRLMRGEGYGAAPRTVRRELARLGAMLLLRERGVFHVHAAAVVMPGGGAVLLAGESGSGKSTLAYGLARAGWPVLGEDGVLVECVEGAPVARAWRDPLRVSIELAPYFPELRQLEHAVDWSDPRHRVPVAIPFARRAPVAAIAFVQRAERDAIEGATQTEALAALVRQSATVLLSDASAGRHLAALRSLVMSVPLFRLLNGPEQPVQVARTLARALA